jgi:hypothetical protein
MGDAVGALDQRGEMKFTLLCSTLGASAKRADGVARVLEKNGYLKRTPAAASITPAGQKKLQEIDAELAGLIDLGPKVPIRLAGMVKSVRLLSRMWQRQSASLVKNLDVKPKK